jgi:hypothetical protein
MRNVYCNGNDEERVIVWWRMSSATPHIPDILLATAGQPHLTSLTVFLFSHFSHHIEEFGPGFASGKPNRVRYSRDSPACDGIRKCDKSKTGSTVELKCQRVSLICSYDEQNVNKDIFSLVLVVVPCDTEVLSYQNTRCTFPQTAEVSYTTVPRAQS